MQTRPRVNSTFKFWHSAFLDLEELKTKLKRWKIGFKPKSKSHNQQCVVWSPGYTNPLRPSLKENIWIFFKKMILLTPQRKKKKKKQHIWHKQKWKKIAFLKAECLVYFYLHPQEVLNKPEINMNVNNNPSPDTYIGMVLQVHVCLYTHTHMHAHRHACTPDPWPLAYEQSP